MEIGLQKANLTMNSKIISEILKNIKESKKRKATHAIIKNYRPISFSLNNFHDIHDGKSSQKIAFVDGGNAEIINSSELSIQLIQVFGSIKDRRKNVKTITNSFYTLTQSEELNNEIIFKTKIFPLKGEKFPDEADLSINSMDETVKEGVNRASISCVGGIARKFAEWQICEELMQSMSTGDMIVKDGNLDTDLVNERRYFGKASDEAKKRNLMLIGLAKTSKIFCDNGNNANIELDSISPYKKWFYFPVAEKCGTMFAKLNDKSKHVFRVDFLANVKDAEMIASRLAEESKDMTFPGYPYGLIEADAHARVSNQEKDFLKTLLLSKAGNDVEKIEKLLTTENAHQILDKMQH